LQLSVSAAKFFGIEYCGCTSSQKFRSARSVLCSQSIKSRDEIVVQLHQHLASSHESYVTHMLTSRQSRASDDLGERLDGWNEKNSASVACRTPSLAEREITG